MLTFVLPAARRRGLVTQMLRQGIELARGFGFSKLLAVCDADNAASKAVILKNGGVLEDSRFYPDDSVWVRRYWLPL